MDAASRPTRWRVPYTSSFSNPEEGFLFSYTLLPSPPTCRPHVLLEKALEEEQLERERASERETDTLKKSNLLVTKTLFRYRTRVEEKEKRTFEV